MLTKNNDPCLTSKEIDEVLNTKSKLFCPDPTGIKVGDKYQIWLKVGGEMGLVEVWISHEPYHPDSRKYLYVDVYGWGIRTNVNVTKLLTSDRSKRQ